jgi:hypothetical protein
VNLAGLADDAERAHGGRPALCYEGASIDFWQLQRAVVDASLAENAERFSRRSLASRARRELALHVAARPAPEG